MWLRISKVRVPTTPAHQLFLIANDADRATNTDSWFSVESIVSLLFIAVVGCVPVILILSRGKGITKSNLGQAVALAAWLVGGIYMFTSALSFSSSHFEGERPLTLVEAIYFMVQIVTTVGYGDMLPTAPGGQLFLAAYVLVTILLIAQMITEVVDLVMQYTGRAAKHAATRTLTPRSPGNQLAGNDKTRLVPAKHKEQVLRWLHKQKPTLPWMSLLVTSLVYLFFVASGTLFFHFYPGEGKTVLQGVYMSVITLSSVGFGALTPSTPAGKAFCTFWMLFGVAALVATIQAFGNLMQSIKRREEFHPAERQEEFERLVSSLDTERNGGMLDKYEFLKLVLMNSRRLHVTVEEFSRIEQAFQVLGPDSNGLLSLAFIRQDGTPVGSERST